MADTELKSVFPLPPNATTSVTAHDGKLSSFKNNTGSSHQSLNLVKGVIPESQNSWQNQYKNQSYFHSYLLSIAQSLQSLNRQEQCHQRHLHWKWFCLCWSPHLLLETAERNKHFNNVILPGLWLLSIIGQMKVPISFRGGQERKVQHGFLILGEMNTPSAPLWNSRVLSILGVF